MTHAKLSPRVFSQKGYLDWHEAHPELHDELGDTPGACWSGACYILDTLGLPIRENGNVPPNYKKEFNVDDLVNQRGWVHFLADCKHEVHYFSFYIEDDGSATLIHVYGALKKKKINLNEWIKTYKEGKWLALFSAKNPHIPKVVEAIEMFLL